MLDHSTQIAQSIDYGTKEMKNRHLLATAGQPVHTGDEGQ